MMKRLLILGVVIGILVTTFPSAFLPGVNATSSAQIKPTCTDSLQMLVNATPAGETLVVSPDCIYRETVTVTSPLVLDGQGGAEIRGSDIWQDWSPVEGLWVSALVVPWFEDKGECSEKSDGRCLWPEQVFLDGIALRQVGPETIPESGQFSLNALRQVVLADDPTASTVEVTVRTKWLDIQASGTTVQGFTMKHAAVASQGGAILLQNVSNWIVQDNSLSDAHGANVYFRDAPNGQLLNNEIFNGGQLGFGGFASNIEIRGNFVHHNNTEEFFTDWEAGGAKITRTNDLIVDDNHFFSNDGPGFWCDIDCTGITISNNNAHHNTRSGLFFEISDGAEIFGNSVWENSTRSRQEGGMHDAGIFISSARNADVHDNIVAWNGHGILIISQCRAFLADGLTCDTTHPWNNVVGNEVHDNVIVMEGDLPSDTNVFALGWRRDVVDEAGAPYQLMLTRDARNLGYDNSYWIPQPEGSTDVRFVWGEEIYAEIERFNTSPGEENGAYLSNEERDLILEDVGIPLSPDQGLEVRSAPVLLFPGRSRLPSAVMAVKHVLHSCVIL